MSLPFAQLLHQGPVLRSLGSAVGTALWRGVAGGGSRSVTTPGPEIRRTIPPPGRDLIEEFVRRSGGDPASWRGQVPPHLFPQWGFPLVSEALADLPYPFLRVLNAGSAMTMHRPIPAGVELAVTARFESCDADDRRALLRTRLTTGPVGDPGALVADLFAYVPLAGGGKAGGEKKTPETAPGNAREIARWRLGANAGAEFALLTGDVNPIHWLPPYARAFGFRNVILHGFGTMARAVEGLVRGVHAGEGARLKTIDVRFARPLALPAEVGLYVAGEKVFVADALGGPAYLVGSFTPGVAVDE